MAIAKVILNGVTQMDVTQKTVTAGSMLSGTTALKNDGTDITGNIASKSSSDLTASGATVTAPAGYYASAASKSVASGSAATPATTITANPTVSVNSSGLITATVSKTQSVTPSVSAGYVSSGTAGTITVSGSGTSQLTTQAAQTIHPSTTDQTIASGRYLTGAQTIKAVTVTNLTAANIVQGVTVKIGDSTDDDCVASVTGTAETGGDDFVITLTENASTGMWEPDYTFAEAQAAYTGGKTIAFVTSNGRPCTGMYDEDSNGFVYFVYMGYSGSNWRAVGLIIYLWTSTGVIVAEDPEQSKNITYYTNNATAVPADVASGKTFYNADGLQTGTASGGGGTEPAERSDVNFIDYDGTILYSYTAAEAAELTTLPSNPSHSGLTAQGWNYTLAQIKTEVTAQGKCDIGQMYVTSDGKTRVYCHFETGRLSPYLGLGVNGTVTIDWGDGSATDTLTGTSYTASKSVQHTYASAGDYVITLTATSGGYSIFGSGSGTHLIKNAATPSSGYTQVYASAVKKVELGSSVRLGDNAFYYCVSLDTISIPQNLAGMSNYPFRNCYRLVCANIPSGITSIGTYAFQACASLHNVSIPPSVTTINGSVFEQCRSLADIVIPSTVTTIGTYMFSTCYSMNTVTIPSGVTGITTYMFSNCGGLSKITIPSGVTSIAASAFASCAALKTITVPSGVTSIAASAFSYCYGVAEYHFKPTTPPTLANTNAFNNIASDCKIYVPYSSDHSILEAYQTATNWSTYASYMVEESA